MSISTFDLFSIGIGPSSSHTVGPMLAALTFINELQVENNLDLVEQMVIDLYGSLALTGKGHGTDHAIMCGLSGYAPDTIDPLQVIPIVQSILNLKKIHLAQSKIIPFIYEKDLIFHTKESLPKHANGMCFTALDSKGTIILKKIFYSIGGGFIVDDENFDNDLTDTLNVPYPFNSAKELFALCEKHQLSISEIMMENEKVWRNENEIRQGILHIVDIMLNCIERGCHSEQQYLPGSIRVKRRAPALYKKLQEKTTQPSTNPGLKWLNLYALAVNEENAAGGRVVTAPTNGAAGIIPAVLNYYIHFIPNSSEQGRIDYLLTAAAIAILYKKGASISAAEVGCQGEIGVAASMAAGALTAVLGGTLIQIEKAAEIAMEHNLGLTCDPIAGLVQIPCIERNAMGSVQAINACELAMLEDDRNKISLDEVIATMLRTGKDMKDSYKETSKGGLAAVNLPEC